MAGPAGQVRMLCHVMHTGLQKLPDMLIKHWEFIIFRIRGGSFWGVESMSPAGRAAKEKYDIMPAGLAAAKKEYDIMGPRPPPRKKKV